MNFSIKNLLSLFTLKRKDRQSAVEQSKVEDDIQDFEETKNVGLKNHLGYLTEYFTFLITDYGFHLKTKRYYSREFWTTYTNLTIDIKIMFESGSELPWIFIEKCNNDGKFLIVAEYSDKMKSILQKKKERIEPIMSRFLNNNYEYSELENDYINIGQHEHREYMEEAAVTLKNILENKTFEISAL